MRITLYGTEPRRIGVATVDYQGSLELVELDARGNARVADCLSDGKTLAQRLATELPIADGTVYAVVGPGVSEDHLYRFRWGGVVPQTPPDQSGWQEVVTAGAVFARAVAARLRDLCGTLVVQDWHVTSSHPGLAIRGHEPWLFGEEVYFVSRDSTVDEAEHLLAMGDLWPGLTALVAEVDLPAALRQSAHEIEPSLLDELVGGARELIIGAYDGESFLLWARDSHAVEFYRSAMVAE